MTTTRTTVQDQAVALLGCKVENVQKYLYALGIRQTCSRCGGSGEYSRCQMYGTTCFKCAGRCYVAAKVTKAVLVTIQEKIVAGELDALKATWRANAEARKAIGPVMDRIVAAYEVISHDYTVGGKVFDTMTREQSHAAYASEWWGQVYRAQGMNNALRWDTASSIEHDVQSGRRTNYVTALAELVEIAELTEALAAAWREFGWIGPQAVEVAA